MNACFQKGKSQLKTFRSSETETMIDYILVSNKCKNSVKDVKLIPGEETVRQHCLLSMDMVFKEGQEESKIQEETETVVVERVGGERRVC